MVQRLDNLPTVSLNGRGHVHACGPSYSHPPILGKTDPHAAEESATGNVDRSHQHRLAGLTFSNANTYVNLEYVACHDLLRFIDAASATFIQFKLDSPVKVVGDLVCPFTCSLYDTENAFCL